MPNFKVGDVVMVEYFGKIWDGEIVEISNKYIRTNDQPNRYMARIEWNNNSDYGLMPFCIQEFSDIVPVD